MKNFDDGFIPSLISPQKYIKNIKPLDKLSFLKLYIIDMNEDYPSMYKLILYIRLEVFV